MDYDVSIVIACYNEVGLLEESVREVVKTMEQTKYSYELMFIDDCSQDATRDLIKKIVKDKPNMSYVFHEVNVGRGQTVTNGIKRAKGRIVGFLDIDLEVHSRYIPAMLLAIDDGYDIATGFRIYKVIFDPSYFIRHILSHGYRKLMRAILRIPLHDTETGYKFFNREKILDILDKTENKEWFWDTEIMALSHYAGLKIIEIPCLFIRRLDKESSVNVFKDSMDYFIELINFRRRVKNDGN